MEEGKNWGGKNIKIVGEGIKNVEEGIKKIEEGKMLKTKKNEEGK